MSPAETSRLLLATAILGASFACSALSRHEKAEPDASAAAASSATDIWTSSQPEPRRGMSYIPPGALVAGSAPNSLPRRPDRELPGEQLMMKGFYVDRFAYPNEEGAIPLTNVSQSEALALCQKVNKRLCTELEWERACKGPANSNYAWGDKYRPDVCQLGATIQPRPSGMRVGCHSDFGVYDMHGGVFEWTSSAFRRGASDGKVTLRGGNGIAGELMGRCANAESTDPNTRSQEIGFRCCAGPENAATVVIAGTRGDAIERIDRPSDSQFRRLLAELHGEEAATLSDRKLSIHRAFLWRPISNEQLLMFTACTDGPLPHRCGLLVGRDAPSQPAALGWASTGYVPSSLHMDEHSESIWLLGLDAQGRFKRQVRYQAGLVLVGPIERRVPLPKKRQKRADR
jgi:formylglycine-generating enzyme